MCDEGKPMKLSDLIGDAYDLVVQHSTPMKIGRPETYIYAIKLQCERGLTHTLCVMELR